MSPGSAPAMRDVTAKRRADSPSTGDGAARRACAAVRGPALQRPHRSRQACVPEERAGRCLGALFRSWVRALAGRILIHGTLPRETGLRLAGTRSGHHGTVRVWQKHPAEHTSGQAASQQGQQPERTCCSTSGTGAASFHTSRTGVLRTPDGGGDAAAGCSAASGHTVRNSC